MSEKTSRTTVLCRESTCLPSNCSREKPQLCQQHTSGPQPQHTTSETHAGISPCFLHGYSGKANPPSSLRAETRRRYLWAHEDNLVLRVRHRRTLIQQNRLTLTAKMFCSSHSPAPRHLSIQSRKFHMHYRHITVKNNKVFF